MRAGTLALAVLGGALLAATVVSTSALLLLGRDAGLHGRAGVLILIVTVAAALAGLAGWLAFQRLLAGPLEALARDIRTLVRNPQERPLALPVRHALDRLPGAVEALLAALAAARRETRAAVDEATARAEEQRSRLEAILVDLTEGVVVCNLEHRILLYNQAAQRLVRVPNALGLDRSLFSVLTREPVVYALDQLLARAPDGSAQPAGEIRRFVAATVDMAALLETRLSLVREPSGEPSGYVLTFAEVSQQIENLAARDTLLREVASDWRRPLANIQAATEALVQHQDLAEAERLAFEEVIAKEVADLNGRLAELTRRYERLAAGPWPLAEIHSLDLFRALQRALDDEDRIALTPVGIPTLLLADSHALMLALQHLLRRCAAHTGTRAFDIAADHGDPYASIEVSWEGGAIPAGTLDGWLDQPLAGTVGHRTARQIVERHGGEAWSRTAEGGRAVIRLALRAAERAKTAETAARVAPRPEYYDFDLFRPARTDGRDTPLRKMRFVVFDTETTGLEPARGDELIAIGAVRVVNGRLLTGESFERLIHPGRDIPPASIKFHGITDDMVKDKPPARVVLPQFKQFVGDSVLVAYNIAFDLAFLAKRAEEAGVAFDNPAVDALLLAAHLHGEEPDLSLSAMAHRFGIEIIGRHTALGDALATAGLWIRLLDELEAKGVTTFGQAVDISSRMMKRRQAMQGTESGW